MDQVKVILKLLQKHHFWLLCVIAMIVALVGWSMARKSLSASYETQKSAINGKFKAMEGLRGAESHPNGTWKTGIDEMTAKERETVGATWEKIYNEQKKLLLWPADLGDTFLKFVNNNPSDAQIPPKLLEIYQNRIEKQFPRLLEIVDAAPAEVQKAGTPAPAAVAPGAPKKPGALAPPNEHHEYKVVWDGDSQDRVRKSLMFQVRPTSAQVRLVQEDLWVYQALLRIVKAVNGEAWVAPIKQISTIDIAKEAAAAFADGMSSNHVEHLGPVVTAGGPTAGGPGGGPGGEAEAAKLPEDERYVDAKDQPMTFAAASAEPYKRMPVFLRLVIDQRQIPKLLVECANSPLPVEVRQLRVNPSHSSSKSTKQATSGQGGSSRPGTTSSALADSYSVPVELHGIIYVYNKPDKAKLSGGVPAAAPPPQ